MSNPEVSGEELGEKLLQSVLEMKALIAEMMANCHKGLSLMKIICIALLTLSSAFTFADSRNYPSVSFEKLKSLTGEWKKEGSDGERFYISFESTAKGSVLVENWIHKGASHSLTIYHLDGDKLLATHYCPQGNQPRLKLDENSAGDVLSFTFQDATNLESLDKSHQHSLGFEFIDADTIVRQETYSKADSVSPSTLILVRK